MQRVLEVALLDVILPALDSDAHLELGRILQNVVVGIDGDAARLAEGLDDVRRVGALYLDALEFSLAVGVNLQLNGHGEQVEVLRDLSGDAEAFAGTINGVLVLERGRSGGVEPLRKEALQLRA